MPRGHREALLTAARTLLRRRGLQATTARDLVEESGTNLASIGYHFGGKDALMGAALAALFEEWTERPVTAARAAGAGGPGEALAAALRAMLGDLPDRRQEILAYAEAIVAAGRGDAVGVGLAASSRTTLAAVADTMAAANPGLPREAAAAGAAVVVALHDGLALLSTVAPEAVPDPQAVIGVLAAFGSVLLPVLGMTHEQMLEMMRGPA